MRDADGLSFEAKSSQSRSLRHPATDSDVSAVAATKDEPKPKAVNRNILRAAAAK